jgi:hypothetical protein
MASKRRDHKMCGSKKVSWLSPKSYIIFNVHICFGTFLSAFPDLNLQLKLQKNVAQDTFNYSFLFTHQKSVESCKMALFCLLEAKKNVHQHLMWSEMCAKSNTKPSFYSLPFYLLGKVSHRISAENEKKNLRLFCCFIIISMMENAFLCFPLQSAIDYFFLLSTWIFHEAKGNSIKKRGKTAPFFFFHLIYFLSSLFFFLMRFFPVLPYFLKVCVYINNISTLLHLCFLNTFFFLNAAFRWEQDWGCIDVDKRANVLDWNYFDREIEFGMIWGEGLAML